jgi:putative phosphonate metabolism protein
MSYTRFAIYYVPPDGALASFGAAWLGWDVIGAAATRRPAVPGIEGVTSTPRKYGFHGTLKPPFVLADGRTVDELQEQVSRLSLTCPPARCDGLRLGRLGHFLALLPVGDQGEIARVAAACVRELDPFRAPPGEAELSRRRKSGLTERQEAMLTTWGYPYVMEEFRFHMTLTGRVPEGELDRWEAALHHLLPALPKPFELSEIALVGERGDGCFELIQRYALAG